MFGTYRTILAIMVVALHLGGTDALGAYAVFGFYVLSGYLMTLIMQKSYGYSAQGVLKYGLNRFLRLYPIYWISVLISFFVIYAIGEDLSVKFESSLYLPSTWVETLRNIFIFFPFLESPRLAPPSWALTVEIFFYILIGLGLSKSKIIVFVWFALSLLYHLIANILIFDWYHIYFTPLAASLPFSTGALIFYYRDRLYEFIKSKVKGAFDILPLIVIIFVFLNWYIGQQLDLTRGASFYINFILCAFMVMILSNRKYLLCISKRVDSWLGDFSYPIYLIHFQVGLVVVLLQKSLLPDVEIRPSIQLFMLSLPVIFLISWVMMVSIEKPIELIRQRLKQSL
jgi:peptidoglycan/LPS O-acetylase OafA/YrhL